MSSSTSCPLDTGSRAISHISAVYFIGFDYTRCSRARTLTGAGAFYPFFVSESTPRNARYNRNRTSYIVPRT